MTAAIKNRSRQATAGFTLIEILTVIAIITIIAALVAGLAGGVGNKKRRALVEAEKNKLVAMIENYHSKMGFYPPDNPNVSKPEYYDYYGMYSASNQLYYELMGASFDEKTGEFTAGTNVVTTNEFNAFFARGGVANSAPANSSESAKKFYTTELKSTQFRPFVRGGKVLGLLVPSDLNGSSTNFWHYDASSTNRHNPESFDLWAEFSIGNQIVTNGNWKD